MEERYLKQISDRICQYITRIKYDKSEEFREFYLDMQLNVSRFISSCEEYERNKKILNKAEIAKDEVSKYNGYLLRLRTELITLLGLKKESNEMEIIKQDVMTTLFNFLDPYTYEKNVDILRKAEKGRQKKIDIPRGWC